MQNPHGWNYFNNIGRHAQKSQVLTCVSNQEILWKCRSRYVWIKTPLHKQSEKACMCFKMRQASTRDFTVIPIPQKTMQKFPHCVFVRTIILKWSNWSQPSMRRWMMKILEITYSLESRVCATVPMARFVHRVEPELPTVPSFPAKPTGAVHVFFSRFYPDFIQILSIFYAKFTQGGFD